MVSAEEICMQRGESAQERGYACSKWQGCKNPIESMLRRCHYVPWMAAWSHRAKCLLWWGFHLSVTRSFFACASSPFWNGMFIQCHWKYVTSFWFYIGSRSCLESLGETLLCSLLNKEKLLRMWWNLKVDRVQFALWDGTNPWWPGTECYGWCWSVLLGFLFWMLGPLLMVLFVNGWEPRS